MKYDYLIVGAGLYGAVFAHEMTKRGKNVSLLISGIISRETFIPVSRAVFRCINMARISSIPAIRKYGTMSINLRNLIIILTPLSPFITTNYTISHLI